MSITDVKRDLLSYMLGRIGFAFFDFSEPRIIFLFDYLTVLVLFAFAGTWLTAGLSARRRQKTAGSEKR